MEQQNNSNGRKKRPGFLSVLCILTFAGSGLGMLGGLFTLIAASMADFLSTVPGFGNAIEAAAIAGTTYSVISVLLSFVSLLGAIFIWNLKKTGFWMYTVAQVAMLILPFLFLPSILAMVGFILSVVFTAVFIILNAVNYKHLS